MKAGLLNAGQPETAAKIYYDFARVIKQLRGVRADPLRKDPPPDADYEYDEKHMTVSPFPPGIEKVERALRIENLYAPQNSQLVNHMTQAMRAQSLYNRDIEYVIQDGEVKIVDEFTGRVMEGRRWSEGLHQAVEAKEGVRIREEHVTLATITLQNYFRLYEKLGGMTGTAKTEEKEFVEIYNLGVVEIPTNEPVIRMDENDLIFKNKESKFGAVVKDIQERYEHGQPVLVGTIAVETSEYLSQHLERAGVPHNVLNAKQHEREAEIIKGAGERLDKDRRIQPRGFVGPDRRAVQQERNPPSRTALGAEHGAGGHGQEQQLGVDGAVIGHKHGERGNCRERKLC